jgi:hypothetical protein
LIPSGINRLDRIVKIKAPPKKTNIREINEVKYHKLMRKDFIENVRISLTSIMIAGIRVSFSLTLGWQLNPAGGDDLGTGTVSFIVSLQCLSLS